MKPLSSEQIVWELSECPGGMYPTLDDYTRALAQVREREHWENVRGREYPDASQFVSVVHSRWSRVGVSLYGTASAFTNEQAILSATLSEAVSVVEGHLSVYDDGISVIPEGFEGFSSVENG